MQKNIPKLTLKQLPCSAEGSGNLQHFHSRCSDDDFRFPVSDEKMKISRIAILNGIAEPEEVEKEIPIKKLERVNLNLKPSLLDYWEVRFVLFGVTVNQLFTCHKITKAGVRRAGILLCRPYVPWKSLSC